MKTLYFDGKMTSNSPITVILKGSEFGGMNRMPRAGRPHVDTKAYFPATSIRGAIRNAIHRVVVSALDAQDQSLDLAEHFMLAQGVDITGEITNEKTDGVINLHKELRKINPALSLTGRWRMRSQIGVGNAHPNGATADVVGVYGNGARTICFERDEALYETLADDQKSRLDLVLENQAAASVDKKKIKADKKELLAQLKSAEGEMKKAIQEQIKGLDELESKINKSESGEGSGGIRRPLDGFEAFNEGVEFGHKLSIHNASDIEVGLFLAGLRQFCRNPYLGGKRALNMGLVSFEWAVSMFTDDDALEPEVIGKISVSEKGMKIEGDLLKGCLAEWDEAKHELTKRGIDFKKVI